MSVLALACFRSGWLISHADWDSGSEGWRQQSSGNERTPHRNAASSGRHITCFFWLAKGGCSEIHCQATMPAIYQTLPTYAACDLQGPETLHLTTIGYVSGSLANLRPSRASLALSNLRLPSSKARSSLFAKLARRSPSSCITLR